jgi:hypothetical protein
LLGEDHLFENASSAEYLAQDRLTIDAIETLFYGKNRMAIVTFHVDDASSLAVGVASDEDARSVEIDWGLSVEFMPDPIKYAKEISTLQLDSTFTFDIVFTTEVVVSSHYSPGDYYNPPESDWEIEDHQNIRSEMWIDGAAVDLSSRAKELFTEDIAGVSPSNYFSDDIEHAIKKNYKGTVSELFSILLKK